MLIAETEANITMFNSMIRRKIPTNDIRRFAVKQATQCRVYRQTNSRMEGIALRIKRMDAIAFAKRQRHIKHKNKLSLIACYSDKDRAKKIINRINTNAREYKRWLKRSKDRKIDHLELKYAIEDKERRSL